MNTTDEQPSEAWFHTASGGLLYLDRPDPAAITIDDIAHALARLCRFGGHVAARVSHYSVAQHSVLVSQFCPPDLALVGLLHDAAEAYLGDVVRPLKALLPAYAELEAAWEAAIGERFGLGDQLAHLPPAVKAVDDRALATEHRDLLADGPGHRRWNIGSPPLPVTITPLAAQWAQDAFLAQYTRLAG